jgi:hypothetical protein
MDRARRGVTQDVQVAFEIGLTAADVQDLKTLLTWARSPSAWKEFLLVCRLLAQRGIGKPAPPPAVVPVPEKPARARQATTDLPQDDRPASAASLARLDAIIDHVATGAAFPAQRARRE